MLANRSVIRYGVVVVIWLMSTGIVSAASHLWRINELFSNADGTVQFIELRECCGGTAEVLIGGLNVTSEATGNVFTIPDDIFGKNTAFKHLLFATQAFADLPGAPTPDYIISENFFSTSADVVWWSPERSYDSFTFGVGVLPIDGLRSIHVTDYVADTFVLDENSPTNFAGDTGPVWAGGPVPAVSYGGIMLTIVALSFIGTLIIRSTRKPADP